MNFRNVKVLGVTSILALVASCSNPSNFEVPTLNDDETSTSVFGGKKLTQATPDYIFVLTGPDGILCHGTRISDNYILTAAHCLSPDYKATQWPLMRLDKNNKPIYYKNAIVNVAIHPKYEERDKAIIKYLKMVSDTGARSYVDELINNYDLGLVKVRPEVLPSNQNNPVSFRAPVFDIISAARGIGIKSAFMYSKLEHKDLLLHHNQSWSSRVVELDLVSNIGNDNGNMWIRDKALNIAACSGDSGAGVFIKDPHASNVIYLIGTIVGGPSVGPAGGPCSRHGTLANVTMAYEWISEVIAR